LKTTKYSTFGRCFYPAADIQATWQVSFFCVFNWRSSTVSVV